MFHSSATKIWNTKPNLHGLFFLAVDNPTLVVDLIGSIYGIFTDILIDLMLDVGKHTIHGSYGVRVFWLVMSPISTLPTTPLSSLPTEPRSVQPFPVLPAPPKCRFDQHGWPHRPEKMGSGLKITMRESRVGGWTTSVEKYAIVKLDHSPKRDEIKNIWVATT